MDNSSGTIRTCRICNVIINDLAHPNRDLCEDCRIEVCRGEGNKPTWIPPRYGHQT